MTVRPHVCWLGLGCWFLTATLLAQQPPPLPEVPPERPGSVPPPAPTTKPDEQPPLLEPGCTRLTAVTRALLVEEQKAVVVPTLKLRECQARESVLTPTVEYKKETQRITVMTVKPRTEERRVLRREPRIVTTCDPVTGRPCTTYESVQVVKTIKVVVYDCVPEEKVVAVQVPHMQPKPQDVLVKTYAADHLSLPGVQRHWQAVILRNEVGVPECHGCAGATPEAPCASCAGK